MRSWVPVPGTTSGKLVYAALELFGSQGFSRVSVVSIAEYAGVTTGSLYHHFESKAGLYQVVRADVEQRVLDRLEGAAAAQSARALEDIGPVLLVGFDFLVSSGFARLLGEPRPEQLDDPGQPDVIEQFIERLLTGDTSPLEALVAAAWRAALWNASEGPGAATDARAALARLLVGSESIPSRLDPRVD